MKIHVITHKKSTRVYIPNEKKIIKNIIFWKKKKKKRSHPFGQNGHPHFALRGGWPPYKVA